jgi:2-keto-4-pentenoate hydratase/2-oxohepta-3-ene-1,7-dioic acid hydratase in catechol pathway
MKLCTFAHGDETRIGIVRDGTVIDLAATLPKAPRDMIGLIREWDVWREQCATVERSAQGGVALDKVRLLAPVTNPRKVLAIGLNYADHIAETGMATPTAQIWFCKQPTAVNGPYDPIELPKASTMVDYEGEMVAIVGNDVSARDWQRKTAQWMMGKSFDTHAPFGPWITTADEVGDPHALGLRTLVNGEVRQSSNTENLVFSTFDQIAEVSQAFTLEPGDVIYTGTPGGVGLAMKPPSFLQKGDRVRVEMDKLGHIEGVMTPEA